MYKGMENTYFTHSKINEKHFSIFILCDNVGLDSTLGWHQTNKSCAFIYAGLEPKRTSR
jgi:hypothetical protein